MKNNIFTNFFVNCLASLLLIVSTTSYASTGAEYVAIPPFVTSGAPPLVMLVMGKNHKLYYEAYNDASDLNDDDVVDFHYSPLTIDYYGYFDSYKCYTYDAIATASYTTEGGTTTNTEPRFNPVSKTTDKTCTGTNEWSGDFLNYLTMSRMDTMRKVLYGGYRKTDNSGFTVLERVFIPHDAHTWGKEYTSIAVDGYDIADYTPYMVPPVGSGLRHLFASTTKVVDGPPLLRVAFNNINRIWDWVSSEAPVAKDSTVLSSGGGHPGHPADHDAFESMVNVFANPAYLIDSGAWLDYTIRNHESERYPGASATDFGAIDGYGNPFGAGYGASAADPHDPYATQQQNYLAVFTGVLNVTTAGDYDIAVDGDDAVEVIIDGGTVNEEVIGYYGAHGACNCQTHHKVITLDAGTHTVEFRMEEAGGGDRYYLYWNGPDSGDNWSIVPASKFTSLFLSTYSLLAPASTIDDYHTRVKVCDSTVGLESNCKQYPDGNYKPIGLLQRHGESKRMYFGLLSGSWDKNTAGGVLRKNVGEITDEIHKDSGKFITVDNFDVLFPSGLTDTTEKDNANANGIIQTINKFKIFGYNYGSSNYNDNCGWITSGPMGLGQCRDWGNPIAEMMYETQRYFAGKTSPTADFTYGSTASIDDNELGLPKPSWIDPYDKTAGGFDRCAKPFMLVLSDINPTFDGDDLPGVDALFGTGLVGDLPGLNVSTLADVVSSVEVDPLVTGQKYIGQSGSDTDGACTVKDVTGFGDIRGLCPEEPTKGGSYYSAAVAYYGHTTDLQTSVEEDQSVSTYAVGLASPLPKIEFEIGGGHITLVPFAKTVGSRGTSTVWNYWPTNTIVDFFVESLTPTSGVFRINYEDVEQGADHDMDDIVTYRYQLVDNAGNAVTATVDATAVDVSLETISASGSYIQHAGYIISGTKKDGTYLEVTDDDTSASDDFLVFLDTPPGVNPLDPSNPADASAIVARDQIGDTHDSTLVTLPYSTTRRFFPDLSEEATAAQLLNNPLWYAAKWGAFEDKDGSGTPNIKAEWDEDGDGSPDTYYYVNNPLRLEEQLNKSFADILNRASSGTAASVISNTRSGEGAIYQSIFFPVKTDTSSDANTVTWVGQVHAFFVDSYGNMREDTTLNHRLDVTGPDLDGNGRVYHEDVNMNCTLDTEDVNDNGTLDSGEDLNSNNELDTEDSNDNGVLDTEYNICVSHSNVADDQFLSSLDAIIVFENGKAQRYFDVNSNEKLDPAEILWSVGGSGIDSDDVKYLWNTSDWLNHNSLDSKTQRTSLISNESKRYIFTWIDADGDGVVDQDLDTNGDGVVDDFDYSEIQDFVWPVTAPGVTALHDVTTIYPYLHLYPSFGDKPAPISSLSTADFESFLIQQTGREINWIRGLDDVDSSGISKPLTISGSDIPGTEMRSRKYNGLTWRLGDIAYSTPTAVSRPSENFHLLYKDASYAEFAAKYHNRRHVVYAGANDGMLHAFNGGFYDAFDKQFCKELSPGYDPYDGSTTNDVACFSTTTMPDIGAELWAYIPFNLLPHLYWLTEKDYGHSYYVDQKPRVFDAKIFPVDTDHPYGWGTVLVVGMRFGGASIIADLNKQDGNVDLATDPTMQSAYIILDITNPEVKPRLLGEISMPKMGFATSYPAVVVMNDGDHDGIYEDYDDTNPEQGENRWFLAFGSGPANTSGEPEATILGTAASNQDGQFYLLDLVKLASNNTFYSLTDVTDTGGVAIPGTLTHGLHSYVTLNNRSFISNPITVDVDLDYNADVVYFGTVSGDATSGWGGMMRRIVVDDPNDGDEDQDPINWIPDNIFMDVGQPITVAPTAGIDDDNRQWLYYGTGRYIVATDASDISKQTYYGIKEPLDGSLHKNWSQLSRIDLADVTDYKVFTDSNQTVTGITSGNEWSDLIAEQLTYDGWYLDFYGDDGASLEGERNVGQGTLIGGLLSFTTFVPSSDICVASGSSNLWALYYKTGTAYFSGILGSGSTIVGGESRDDMAMRKTSLGEGLATSPNIHTGREDGSVVFVQSSTGEIVRIEEDNPHSTKSGVMSWRMR